MDLFNRDTILKKSNDSNQRACQVRLNVMGTQAAPLCRVKTANTMKRRLNCPSIFETYDHRRARRECDEEERPVHAKGAASGSYVKSNIQSAFLLTMLSNELLGGA